MNDSSASQTLDIRELVKRTGLTSRALRFYEARGLISPLRSHTGRRYYGAAELERVHQIIVLKSAGLSLAQIKRLFDGKEVDLSGLLNAQLAMLDEQVEQIDKSRTLIHFALSRIARSEPLDAATFCSLIESGDKLMNQEPKEWKEVTERYFSPKEKADWSQMWAQLPEEFNPDANAAQWKDLGSRIKAALPIKPDSEQAMAFVGEWFALLQPLAAVMTPDMWNGATRMYDDMDNWAGEGAGQVDPGFDKEVWDFMKRATAAKLATGAERKLFASSHCPDQNHGPKEG